MSDPALAALARSHLPAAVAEPWSALQRPAIRLRSAGPGEAVVAQLGGLPFLPAKVGWPRWKGEGWLNYVAAIDFSGLPGDELDIALPDMGRLLLFYRDPDVDDYQTIVEPETPQTQAGARVIYVPDGTLTAERETPMGIKTYNQVPLTAEVVVTAPDWDHPEFRASLQDLPAEDREFMTGSDNSDAFSQALWDQAPPPRHRVGGYAHQIQGPVELDIAMAALGGGLDYKDPVLDEEARQWTLLAQIESDDDAGMAWGGSYGALYWLMRRDDLAAAKFESALFTWQSY